MSQVQVCAGRGPAAIRHEPSPLDLLCPLYSIQTWILIDFVRTTNGANGNCNCIGLKNIELEMYLTVVWSGSFELVVPCGGFCLEFDLSMHMGCRSAFWICCFAACFYATSLLEGWHVDTCHPSNKLVAMMDLYIGRILISLDFYWLLEF